MITQAHLEIGSKIPDFNLPGVDGKNYSPDEFAKSKILVIMFTCNHCPYVQAYENRLVNLQKDFKANGVDFIAINANDEKNYPEDSFENMIKRAQEKKYNFPYLRDRTQEVAKTFGASYTPEVFVFDQNRILQYHGRIDDNWQEPSKVTKQNLKEALEAILTNKPVDRANTQAIGCTVKWAN
ncbi:MAG: thioredoxin family protein [Candidatus Melainabacteria bacterium]|nr:thioredoxin family protein [Candidatus Melainabacteria bacterium]